MESVSIVDIYEDILQGKRKIFPKGTWNYESDAIRLVKYLIEEKLQWDRDDVCNKLNGKIFRKWKLGGMLSTFFQDSPFKGLEKAYPGEYKPWELKSAPQSYWTTETSVLATKWLIDEKLKWSRNDVCKMLNKRVFKDSGLEGMLEIIFKGSPYAALEAAYPGEYKSWELRSVFRGFWTTDSAIGAIKWMIEEKLGWSIEQARTKVTQDLFKQYGLGWMLKVCFNNNPHKAIEAAYPE